MSIETKSHLSEETLDRLQELIQVNIDSLNGLREAVTVVDDDRVRNLFQQVLSERASFASELQVYVEWNDELPRNSQSFAGRVHQAWMDLRAKLNSGNAHVLLVEAERGEDHIKEAYEEALIKNPGSAVSEILHDQYAVIKRGHDRIRDMRDEYAQKS